MTNEAESLLRDAMGLWLHQPTEAKTLVDAATEALVAGLDTPALRQLAGASRSESQFILQDHVDASLSELALSPFPDADAIQVAATRMRCRQLLRGELSARELARWTHRSITHQGAPSLQRLVELDDDFDLLETGYGGTTQEEVERLVYEQAEALLGDAGSGGSVRTI